MTDGTAAGPGAAGSGTAGSGAGSWADPAVVRRLRDSTTTWAVVGLSANPSRAAYSVAAFLQQQGKRIVPVHPEAGTVHGEPGYARLADLPAEVPIDVVDVFVRSELAGAVVDEAIAVGARAVWLQVGVVDEDAFARARAAGLDVVMDACPKIEWPRLA